MLESVLLIIITLIAYFVKGITGFGNTLIVNSLFNLLKENRFTTPIDLLLGTPTNSYMAWRERRHISLKIVIPLSCVVIIGAIPGILMLKVGGERILKSFLGLVLIGIAVEMMIKKPDNNSEKKQSSYIIWIVGLFSGVLMGLYGIGALLAAYINRTTINRSEYRANLCFIFLIENLFRLIGYCYFGLINTQMMPFAFLLLPAAIVGLFIGIKADKKISDKMVKNLVIILLIISGATLIGINRFGL